MQADRITPVKALESVIARDFRGGLNTVDSELNLNSKYYVQVKNLYPDSNGRLHLRYGTSPFADVSVDDASDPAIDEVVGMEYYAGAIIVVGANGVVVSVDASGVVTQIFNTTIAAALPGAPAGWSTTLTYASFTQFAGQLIVCNGVDKPISIDETYTVTYLQDPATGSNANVPIAKYCTTHNNHLVLAVTPTDTYTVYIAGTGTTTFVGDPPPNNAANIDLSTYVDRGVPIITGLTGYRDRLIVTFQEVVLAVSITVPTSGSLIPTVTDILQDHGSVSHKAIVPLGDNMLFMDAVGVATMRRSALSSDMSLQHVDGLIATEVQKSLARLSNSQIADYVYAIHDRIAKQVLFMIPKVDAITATTPNDIYVYCYDQAQKWSAWTMYDDMVYRAACRSTEGRIFFGAGTSIRYYHNAYEPQFTDVGDFVEQAWDDGDFWDDGTGWHDPSLMEASPIAFTLKLPNTDFKRPMHSKLSKYISMLTEGTATFTLSMYTDKFTTAPLTMDFTATDGAVPTSSSNRTVDHEQLYAWTQKFVRMQLVIDGVASNEFNIVAIGMLYLRAGIGR